VVEIVEFEREGKSGVLAGRVLVEAQDGGILLEGEDGQLWPLLSEQVISRRKGERPFRRLGSEELARKLQEELPPGFAVKKTAHYLIVYQTNEAYASWCGWLFERLYTAFINFWKRRGLPVQAPEYPLVAIVFANRSNFQVFAREEAGQAAATIIGYYHLEKNRMVLYDITETATWARPSTGSKRTLSEINRIFLHPEAHRTVATIIHEATHQLCFNCGLLRRFSDCPLWLSEGIAIYFETPDLQSTSGWRGVGELNSVRLADFRQYLATRPEESLKSLIATEDRFRDPRQAQAAYAEAWALTYFLIRRYPERFNEYLRLIGQKPLMIWDDESTRIKDFQEAFGPDLDRLDEEFLRYMERLK